MPDYVYNVDADGNVEIKIKCPLCNLYSKVRITCDQLKKLNSGEGYIQDIFYDKTPDERELFITGYCKKCWDNIFGDSED